MALSLDRVRREIKAEGLALARHPLRQRPRRVALETDRGERVRRAAEQRRLSAVTLVVRARGMGEDGLGAREDRGPVGLDRLQRAGAGEAFELAAVEQAGVDPAREILKAGKRAAAPTLRDQRFHRFLADALERAERVADLSVLDREMRLAGVDVGGQAL